jgi:hypothetical protein
LDSPSYNDKPNQLPVKHRTGDRALGKSTAQQIVCCPSSFSTSEAAAVSLPMPMVEGDHDASTAPEFLTAILEVSKSRAEKKRLLLVEKKIQVDKIAKAGKEEKVALPQEEEARLQALLPEARMMEEETGRGLKEGRLRRVTWWQAGTTSMVLVG